MAATNAANPPYCTDHGVDNANAKCHGCRAYREWLERQALQGKRAVRDAIGACSDCDEDGWAYGPDGYTVTAARCALHANHGHARRSA